MSSTLISRLYPALRAALVMICCVFTLPALAAPFTVNIEGSGSNVQKIVFATPMGSLSRADALQQNLTRNMSILPFIEIINPQGIPGGATVSAPSGQGIDFKKFLLAGTRLLITTNWIDSSQVELRAFDVADGRFLFGNRYAVAGGNEGTADVADKFCDEFLKAIIGRGGLFSSTLAFVRTSGANKKDIWAVKANGRNLNQLTKILGESLSPSWSPDGRSVVFSNIEPRSHGLGIYSVGSGTTQRIKFPGNTVIGPCYMPDGRVAVSLSDGRNPSIFTLTSSYQRDRTLENSSAIDVSPSIDAAGAKMAFTSSRLGSPQVFLKDLRGGGSRRISQQGNYNTDPSISPDGTLVAFARRMDGGHRIFVYDLVKNEERQITFGPGSDEEPAFAPDSYFIAFMSTRNGRKQLYITARSGGNAVLLPTGSGDASFPAWSPVVESK